MVGMSIISNTSSNLINPADKNELTPENIKERVLGSKMVLVVEQMQIITIWTMKYCLLLMYNRLTYVALHHFRESPFLTCQQHEFASKPGRQDCRWIRHGRIRPNGDSLPRSLVPALQSVLGCPPREQYVLVLSALFFYGATVSMSITDKHVQPNVLLPRTTSSPMRSSTFPPIS